MEQSGKKKGNFMLPRNRRPTPPGTILLEHYLKPRGISISRFARAIGVSQKHMSNVIHGKVRVGVSLAYKVGGVLGTSADLWLNLQRGVDLYDAKQSLENWQPTEVFVGESQSAA
ncbi:MAG: HigA family addiction module antitoxin [Alphaproteobacteria bacterium]|nr:HigA family addiction module antitoxin [Alphaproteobacteria bacterium]MDP7164821.1 HigA family addiction module antitoxin [Alphaproteobacteria bacterium]MDP7429412.1 HigA family addiction module antitoxin [Alphaproteobacteria bacterium]